MSLSSLLVDAHKALVSHWRPNQQPMADKTPAVVLFVSMGDRDDRATTFQVVGNDFESTWQACIALSQDKTEKEKLNVSQLRVDWVVGSRAMNWAQFKDRLTRTKRNFLRVGVAFDPDFKVAFLEQELNANSMLYPANDKEESRALFNEKNFNDYVLKRYGKNTVVDLGDDAYVCLFSTAAIYISDQESAQYIAPPNITKTWTDASHLNTGHRFVQQLSPEQVYTAFESATEFLAHQIQDDGSFIYGIYPCFDRKVPSYNTLRHASSLYSMLEGYEVTQSAFALDRISKGIHYLATQLIKPFTLLNGVEVAYLVDIGDEIKLGGNAVSILALVKYTQLTQDTQYLPLLEKLALGFGYMQHPETGQFAHVLNASGLTLKALHRTVYYDGEATFALMRLYGLTKDERWLAMVEKAFEYFIAENLSKAKDHWLSYCVNELTIYRPEEKYFYFGIQNVIHNLDFILNRETTYPTLLELMMAAESMLQRIKKMPNMRHLLSLVDETKFYRALHHRAHYLMHGYFWPEMAMFYKKPAKVVGSFFIRHHRFRIRIDDVQHYISGLVAYRRFLLREPSEKVEQDQLANFSASTVNPSQVAVALTGMQMLKQFDKRQLFRLVIDGRLHKRYQGWLGYESGERGSVQALMDGLSYMLDHFDLTDGLLSTYLLDLHKVCMMGVQTKNLKSSPGDLRFLVSGMPFLAKTTSLENVQEVLEMRKGDGTPVFNTKSHHKPAEALDAQEVFDTIQREGKLNYRNWYPNLSQEEREALEKKHGLVRYYEVKHQVQMLFAEKVELIVARFNENMRVAKDQDDRLIAIALVVRELELLHLFPDGNCRTLACVLLNQLLLNYGFSPTCLLNPNLDGELGLQQWVQEIRDGMLITQTLLENPKAKVYDYSIDDAPEGSVEAFAEMTKEVEQKIADFRQLNLSPDQLQQITQGTWLIPCPAFKRFSGIAIDDQVQPGSLYFALDVDAWLQSGESVTSALQGVVEQGAKAIVMSHPDLLVDLSVPVLVVSNVLLAYQQVVLSVGHMVKSSPVSQMSAYQEYVDIRASLLVRFFNRFTVLASQLLPMRVVDEVVRQSDAKRFVLTEDFCHRWFNNVDKLTDVSSKAIFGRFYDFGHPSLLLHVAVGSFHWHIGFVSYQRQDNDRIVPNKMSDETAQMLQDTWLERSLYGLEYREWGLGWLSIDLGRLIDVDDPYQLATLADLANQPVWQQTIMPWLQWLAYEASRVEKS